MSALPPIATEKADIGRENLGLLRARSRQYIGGTIPAARGRDHPVEAALNILGYGRHGSKTNHYCGEKTIILPTKGHPLPPERFVVPE